MQQLWKATWHVLWQGNMACIRAKRDGTRPELSDKDRLKNVQDLGEHFVQEEENCSMFVIKKGANLAIALGC